MPPLLTPKLDLVFKLLFTQDREILLNLVNSMLVYPDHLHLQGLEIKNPEILPEELGEKFIILDILAMDEQRRQYDIEMQVQRFAAYPERALYYLCRLYGTQLERGESYQRLMPVIGIHFLDYEQYPDYPDQRLCFELRELRHPELRLSRDLALHLFELPKLRRPGQPEEWGNPEFEWLHFLNYAHEEETEMRTQYTVPSIQRAFNLLEELSADELNRRRAEMREKALKNEVSMLESAREEGVKEGLKKGMEKGIEKGMEKGMEKGREAGLKEGVLMGIAALLDVKFGSAGMELLPAIRALESLERLQELSDLLRNTTEIAAVKEFLKR